MRYYRNEYFHKCGGVKWSFHFSVIKKSLRHPVAGGWIQPDQPEQNVKIAIYSKLAIYQKATPSLKPRLFMPVMS